MNNEKLRVWWRPQLGVDKTFYVNVESPVEGWKMLQVLAVYDLYQLQQNVKPDFCNVGGLEYYDEEEQEWFDWYDDDGDDIDNLTEALAIIDEEGSISLESWKDKLFEENLN